VIGEVKMAATGATVSPTSDDAVTVCAISLLSAMVANVVHEGLGHGAVALMTGTQSGVLTTVAWSSAFDSKLVAAGGTLANLAAGIGLWFALRSAKLSSVHLRFFLLTSVAFNLLAGTGYFFFSGVTNFGDWAVVITDLHPYWLWRTLLVVIGMASYYVAILVVGLGLVRYVGVPRTELRRLRKLTFIPYFSAAFLLSAGGLLNPIGIQLVWQSALPGAAGADSGLLWLRYYIPKKTVPEVGSEAIGRIYVWIIVAAILSLIFIFVLGRGITLHR
jgi:hypothetical protein